MLSTSIRNIAISLGVAVFALGATSAKADRITVFGNTHPNLANNNITSLTATTTTFTVTNLSGAAPFSEADNFCIWLGPIKPVTVDVGHTPVPEPATMLLLGSGLIGIAAKLRSHRKP